jgi:hypothetical protein
MANAAAASHSPRIWSDSRRPSLPPATGTVTSSRRKASRRVIGAGGSIQDFVTDGSGLVGPNLTWTDVGRPNVQPDVVDWVLGSITTDGAGRMPVDPPAVAPPTTIEEALMPSKLRRTRITLQAKAYRSAVALAGLLVLLEALGAPRKL